MDVIAHARHIRMSPRKVRLVVDLVRGMDAEKAAAQLKFYRKDAARPVLKLLESAIANAEHNFKLPTGDLYIKTAKVDMGPTLKRWRARAFGRAAEIRKHSCHITMVLAPRGVSGTPDAVGAAVVGKSDAKAAAAKPAKKAAAAKKPVAAKKAAKAKNS